MPLSLGLENVTIDYFFNWPSVKPPSWILSPKHDRPCTVPRDDHR